ncbi:MAG: thioredoxin family protein [Candidatus Omnitrophota bacterium]
MKILNYIINLILIIIILSFPLESSAEINVGDSREEVIMQLGVPSGQLKSDSEEILTYSQGFVTILNGKVINMSDNFKSVASTEHDDVSIGSTRGDVIAVYGQPSGELQSGEEDILTYPGGIITIKDDKVIYMDDDFNARLDDRKKDDAFKEQQKAKGLVWYYGRWVTQQEQSEMERKLSQDKAKKNLEAQPILIFSSGGQALDIKEVLVPNKITIIDFYADWCGPCRQISPYLEQIARNDPDVYLRKIDIVNWQTPIVAQYSIKSVPNIRVFNRSGKMVGQPTYDLNKIQEWVQSSK